MFAPRTWANFISHRAKRDISQCAIAHYFTFCESKTFHYMRLWPQMQCLSRKKGRGILTILRPFPVGRYYSIWYCFIAGTLRGCAFSKKKQQKVAKIRECAFSRKKHQKGIKQLIHIDTLKQNQDIAKGATNVAPWFFILVYSKKSYSRLVWVDVFTLFIGVSIKRTRFNKLLAPPYGGKLD